MQSRRLIPPLLLPPTDPAGAKPRRDHRFLDRVSRREVPKTPGNDDAFKVYDPARVSHIPVSQPVRHPSGVAGSHAMPDPRVVGATPLDPGLNDEHPFRGASPDDLGGYPSHPSRKGEAPDISPARSRLPDPAGAKPRRDRRLLDRASRHAVPKTPGKKTSGKIYRPR